MEEYENLLAQVEGYDEFVKFGEEAVCPYKVGEIEWHYWQAGFNEAMEDFAL